MPEIGDPLDLQYFIFVVISPVALISIIIPLITVWKNRFSNRTGIYLFLLLIDTAGWLIFNTLELVAASEFWTLCFTRLSYPFIVVLPGLWFLFARVYEGKSLGLKWRNFAVIFSIPLITLIFVLVPPWNKFVWSSVTFFNVGPFLAFRVTHSPWFWVYMVYVYIFLMYGAVLIFIESLKRQRLFKKQALWMILGVLVPVFANCIYLFKLFPGLVKDFTPLAFMFSGIAFTLGIFKFSLLELLPIARSTVFEHMKDGILILDSLDRIIDINRAALESINCTEPLWGRCIDELETCWPELAKTAKNKKQPVRLKKTIAGTERFFLVDYAPIETRSGLMGWVLEMRDITEEIALLKRIEHMAKTDELTGLPNRRNFSDIAKNEITRSARYGTSLSVVMFDLDFFKNINDTYGHQAGDEVLIGTAELLRASIRDFDVPARVGGEEFIVLMPETSVDSAFSVAERIRKRFEENRFTLTEAGAEVQVTVSIGVTCTDATKRKDLEELFRDADKAMYRSKMEGRNRTTLFRRIG